MPASANPELRVSMAPYDKEALTRDQRAIDGWTSQKDRSGMHPRQQIIKDILSRWWFVFPRWPNPETDYETVLRKRGYREVAVKDWLASKEKNHDGLASVRFRLEIIWDT